MKTIEREHFEAWLYSQPKEREFDYMNSHGECAVCSFIRETTDWCDAVGGSDYGVYRGLVQMEEVIPIPDWMKVTNAGVLSVRPLTIANMRRRYLELFPETEIEVTKALPAQAALQPDNPQPSSSHT